MSKTNKPGRAKTLLDRHMDAMRAFATQGALRMVPPPFNQTRDDLHFHVRKVLNMPITASEVLHNQSKLGRVA